MRFLRQSTPLLIGIFLFFYSWNVYWGGTRWKGFFLADSNGYYAYLPATFIYQDFTFSFIDLIQKEYFSTFGNFDFRQQHKSGIINKWYCGTAVAATPFFLIAHFICEIEGGTADGYSFRYAWGLSVSAIFYCLLGLLVLRKILRRFFRNENLIALLLILVVFATNLFYYATSEPAMSHVYSFAFINLFVLCAIKFIESGKAKFILFSGLLLGMIVIIRPVNALIVFILPFLCHDQKSFYQLLNTLAAQWKNILAGFVLFVAMTFIQLCFYQLESGNWIAYSYGDERLNLLNPHLLDFLFSYKKGLFLYLPLTFLSLAGLFFIYRESRWRFYSAIVFLFLLIYVFSSWWNWWYGGSFGTRPMIEFLFLFAIFLGKAFEHLSGWSKKIFVSACLVCLIIAQVQTYQYRYYFIHWDEMNKERYWNVFMRVDLILKKENPNEDLLR